MSGVKEIDQFSVGRKREQVIAAAVVGLVFSTLSTLLRVWARVLVINRLKKEDWIMIAGLAFSYGALASLLYGQAVGFAEPFDSTEPERRKGYLLVSFPLSLGSNCHGSVVSSQARDSRPSVAPETF
jgi:hypothetical protein